MIFRDQNKAYRGLGLAHKNLGNLQEALVRLFLKTSCYLSSIRSIFFCINIDQLTCTIIVRSFAFSPLIRSVPTIRKIV